MSIIDLTADNFQQEIGSSEVPVLVDFWAARCMPCLMLAPVIHEIAEERDDIKVCKVDVDSEVAVAVSQNIMNIPTLVLYKNGEAVGKLVGVRPKNEILEMIDQNLPSDSE